MFTNPAHLEWPEGNVEEDFDFLLMIAIVLLFFSFSRLPKIDQVKSETHNDGGYEP